VSPKVSERSFEESIECVLLAGGPDACPGEPAVQETGEEYGGALPGGYYRRGPEEYDRALCLIPRDVLDFIYATQPKEWERLRERHGAEVKEKFLKRLAREIESRGALDVLRRGIKDSGCKFDLAYFRPSSGLNPETQKRYQANIFSVIRQVKYSERNENSIDLALFLNGIPIFTAELKNPLTGHNVQDAITQYRTQRDPREPLFKFGRCLAHFAVDPDLVYVTTHLQGSKTRFLPFNQGWDRGAGNPPVREGYATSYLWSQIWARDSVLELIRHFIHIVDVEDDRGRKTGEQWLIFPRYHQLDAVRRLVAHARERGPGERYLIQHSAGSGKSNSIAWLAHRLSVLHDRQDARVFDSIIVITDRRVLDRQLQRTVKQFEQALGVVENIDQTSRQLKDALESGKTIIVTTLQKFPVIADQISELRGKRFAVIIDEAHSSQTGESTKSLKSVLATSDLEEAEREDRTEEEDLEDRIVAEMKKRGRLPNVSMFAFTATPKPKTLELFGAKRPDGKFEPFSLYSMRQAIEEGFILDVLENYTTYKAYWKLLKKIEDDPKYERTKATYLLKAFVGLHPHAIDKKVQIIVDHFADRVAREIKGKAKAMVVTSSRLHAVRYRLAIDKYLKEKGYPFKALVAFSGTVNDRGKTFTEANMNGIPEAQTVRVFEQPEYRLLVVANKFQTGFDQPLLYVMYVDKKLGGVNAVQTLSRLNRVHNDKRGTVVLDLANDADDICKAFEPYYDKTLLKEETDPNQLYDLQRSLLEFDVYTEAEVNDFARLYFDPATKQDRLYGALASMIQRFEQHDHEEQVDFREKLTDYVRLYAFLSQLLNFSDTSLEKLYVFARLLRRYLPLEREELPVEIQQNVDIDSYRLRYTGTRKVAVERGVRELAAINEKGRHHPGPEEIEPLSQIIKELNERFGIELTEEDRLCLSQVMSKLEQDPALDASCRVNPRESAQLTFEHKVEDVLQEIINSNFKLYKRITDDPEFGRFLRERLFDQYLRTHRQVDELIKQGESKTLEFKSTLRYGPDGDRSVEKQLTHAVLKTIAAFLNTDGGDLLIGVADNGTIIGIEPDGFENHDKFLRHLTQVVSNALGDRAATRIDPRVQMVDGKPVCLVACQRSPEPVFLKWKSMKDAPGGDLYVRQGPRTVRLHNDDVSAYTATRFRASQESGVDVSQR
jgi:type I restriction enzyme R subunit